MKKTITLFAVLLLANWAWAQVNPEYIWGGPNSTGAEYDNSTFNGGLNDWTSVPVSSPEANWIWTPDGKGHGGYWGDAGTLSSPTQSNGCAIFDSDSLNYYGDVPGQHKGFLVSPSIDCSGEPEVSVLFYESYRNYIASTYLEVSNDGGNTWTKYDIPYNDRILQNRATGGDAWTYVDISPTAANQADVRFRFVWDGFYYYWIVDDVALIRSPQTDLTIADWFYPAASYSRPYLTGVACDTMGFNCVIYNTAAREHTNVDVTVKVLDQNDTVLHTETKSIGFLPDTVKTDTIYFDNLFVPDLDTGTYRVHYSVTSDGDEFNPGDNEAGGNFVLTNYPWGTGGAIFSKGPGIGSFPYTADPVNDFYAVGSIYQTCDFNLLGIPVAVDSFGFAVHNRDLPSLAGAVVECWLVEVKDGYSPYPDAGIGVGMAYDGWTKHHLAEFEFTSDDQDSEMQWVSEFTNLDGDFSEFILEPNKKYVALVSTSANYNSIGLAPAFSPNMHYAPGYGGMFIIDGDVYGYYTGSTAKPHIVLKLKLLENTKLPRLPETALQLTPNPVTEGFVDLNLQFDKPTDVAYVVTTMSGSILKISHLDAVQKQAHRVDVSGLPAGSYLVTIKTEDGIATRTFSIVR